MDRAFKLPSCRGGLQQGRANIMTSSNPGLSAQPSSLLPNNRIDADFFATIAETINYLCSSSLNSKQLALKLLASASQATRATLFTVSSSQHNPLELCNTGEWLTASLNHQPTPLNLISLDTSSVLYQQLHQGELLSNEQITKHAALQQLNSANTSSIIAPLLIDLELRGLILLQADEPQKIWSGDTQALLKATSPALAKTLKPSTLPASKQYNENHYRYLVEASPALIWSTDKDGYWTFLNPAAEKIFAYPVEEMLGKPLHHFQDQQKIFNIYDKANNTQQASHHEIEFIDKHNTTICLLFNILPQLDAQSQIVGFSGSAIDISELKRIELELRETEKRYEIAARASNDAVWDWSLEAKTLWMHSDSERMFGYSPDEIKSVARWKIKNTHPNDRRQVLNSLKKIILKHHRHWSAEYRFRYGNGSYAKVLDRGYIIYNKQGKAIRIIGAMHDVSEQKHYEKQLRDSRERLRNLAVRLQTAREEERANIARELHDEFAQILTALKLDLDWLQRKLPPHEGKLIERTQEMSQTIGNTMERVWEIATELRPKLLDDLGLIAAIKWQLEKFQDRTNTICSAQLSNLEKYKLDRDLEVALFRIFQEALSNVGRHTTATQVNINIQQIQQQLEMQIIDNGQGIAKQKINDINSLGLTGMRERAGVFGGRISIESPATGGTVVTLRIPLSDSHTTNAECN